MIDALLDTTVILHLFRKYTPALEWFNNPQRFGITSITWLEVMQGASNSTNQERSKELLSQFEVFYLSGADQRWAMQQLEQFQLSHHIRMNDCLIASVSFRLQLPLYTHNLKDMIPMVDELAIKPYA